MITSACFFFFFSRKTAYDLRISDWSSDVCSSDLGRRFNDRDRWLARGQLLFEPTSDLSVRLIADYAKRNEDCCAAVIQPASDTVNVGGAIVTQIGRASVRERVCQYV